MFSGSPQYDFCSTYEKSSYFFLSSSLHTRPLCEFHWNHQFLYESKVLAEHLDNFEFVVGHVLNTEPAVPLNFEMKNLITIGHFAV